MANINIPMSNKDVSVFTVIYDQLAVIIASVVLTGSFVAVAFKWIDAKSKRDKQFIVDICTEVYKNLRQIDDQATKNHLDSEIRIINSKMDSQNEKIDFLIRMTEGKGK